MLMALFTYTSNIYFLGNKVLKCRIKPLLCFNVRFPYFLSSSSLRRCTECGHIGCCDNSPNQYASKHNTTTGHPIITSFEHGEDWFYDYRTGEFFTGPKLVGPHSHPLNQPVPGPQGRIPSDWQSQLHG